MSSAIPRKVVALGTVSLLTNLSSEMVVPVLPLFLTATLAAAAALTFAVLFPLRESRKEATHAHAS